MDLRLVPDAVFGGTNKQSREEAAWHQVGIKLTMHVDVNLYSQLHGRKDCEQSKLSKTL